jgi:ElaB/YqjD/DUF883 family membrane-anchored ribosome-binding protein
MSNGSTVVREPTDMDDARDQVERSRERISETLEAIEVRLVNKKEELRDKVDVLRPVRERVRMRPWIAVAAAVGVGAVLGGVLRRGRGSDAGLDILDAAERRQRREWRAARREHFHTVAGHAGAARSASPRQPMRKALRAQLMGALTHAIRDGLRDRLRR